MKVDIELTEEQAVAVLRAERLLKALNYAPELAEHLRRSLTPADGRTERGELPTDRTPLLTGIADAADELLVTLDGWARAFASDVLDAPPSSRMWHDAYGGERGFRAGTSPTQARRDVAAVTRWLKAHELAIGLTPEADQFRDEVSLLVWQLRARSGLLGTRRGHRIDEFSTRPCPNPDCGLTEVRVEYFGESISAAELRGDDVVSGWRGINVVCMHCGWRPELRASKIVNWVSFGHGETVTSEEVEQTRETVQRPHAAVSLWGGGTRAVWCPVCHCRGYHALACPNLAAPTRERIDNAAS